MRLDATDADPATTDSSAATTDGVPASGVTARSDADRDAADAAAAEAISRAAREAVRQPPDPRLERSFAHLAADGDAPEAPPRSPALDGGVRVPESRTSLEADVERIRDEIAAWRTSTDRIGRQLEIVTWVMIAVTAVFALVALVVLVRAFS